MIETYSIYIVILINISNDKRDTYRYHYHIMREEEPVRESAEYTNKNMNVQMYYDSKLNKSFNQLCLSYVITVCDLKCIA